MTVKDGTGVEFSSLSSTLQTSRGRTRGGARGQVSIRLGTHSSVYSSKRGNCHTIIWLHISGDSCKIVTYFFI